MNHTSVFSRFLQIALIAILASAGHSIALAGVYVHEDFEGAAVFTDQNWPVQDTATVPTSASIAKKGINIRAWGSDLQYVSPKVALAAAEGAAVADRHFAGQKAYRLTAGQKLAVSPGVFPHRGANGRVWQFALSTDAATAAKAPGTVVGHFRIDFAKGDTGLVSDVAVELRLTVNNSNQVDVIVQNSGTKIATLTGQAGSWAMITIQDNQNLDNSNNDSTIPWVCFDPLLGARKGPLPLIEPPSAAADYAQTPTGVSIFSNSNAPVVHLTRAEHLGIDWNPRNEIGWEFASLNGGTLYIDDFFWSAAGFDVDAHGMDQEQSARIQFFNITSNEAGLVVTPTPSPTPLVTITPTRTPTTAPTPIPGVNIGMQSQAYDPYGFPRPGKNHSNVPLLTSFYFQLTDPNAADTILPNSITVNLKPSGQADFNILSQNQQYRPGYSGRIWTVSGNTIAIYIDTTVPLLPSTQYQLTVTAVSALSATLPLSAGRWTFTTEAAPTVRLLTFGLDMATSPSIHWKGGFFTGFCKPGFCTSEKWDYPGTYELMDGVRALYPKAWSLQRDWYVTAFDYQPDSWWKVSPNVVRERETRRIKSMTAEGGNIRLAVEDFYGHQQYGIPSKRPLAPDYAPGNTISIADGINSAQATVISVNEATTSVLVTNFATPSGGWKIAYSGSLPVAEDPTAPGLFPPGGCYLRKLNPAGTPHYYWGRVDKEWDLVAGHHGRRIMPNFCEAPGDLAINGRDSSNAKDYLELREVSYQFTRRIIQRYGAASLDYVWSVFNEPDLGTLFWQGTWQELQIFYDYSVDGILRAFEDAGLDSNKVFIGGLELAAIGGTNLKLQDFLSHCSPTTAKTYSQTVVLNAAYADARLNGKRSKRVDDLCSAHGGRGAPLDFISVHAYNRATMAGNKLIAAKQIALDIDPVYYADLWINTHESVPSWSPPADPAARQSFLGNGYFTTWCADVVRRILEPARTDPRYAYGEGILTFWPWVAGNLEGINSATQHINIDDNGDGVADRKVAIALPLLHYLGLLNTIGNNIVALPRQTVGGHTVSGFADVGTTSTRVLLFSHAEQDTQSRSDIAFAITLNMPNFPWPEAKAWQHQIDREDNSPFRLIEQLSKRASKIYTPQELAQLRAKAAPEPTAVTPIRRAANGSAQFIASLRGNGSNYIVIGPGELSAEPDWTKY